MRPVDNYFLNNVEPVKSCLLFLRKHIMDFDDSITEEWKYGMPFYCYRGKMMCYLWTHKKFGMPYLGIVEGAKLDYPELIQEKRARMKILLIDPQKDIPVSFISDILKSLVGIYEAKNT